MPSVSGTPGLVEVLRAYLETFLGHKFKCLPGKVERYDVAKQVIDAKPLIKRRLAAAGGQEIVEALPVVTNVPVKIDRSSEFFTSYPLAVGDHVLLIGVDRSIDTYVASQPGADVDPDDYRLWDVTDAVALPGFWPDAAALSDVSSTSMVMGRTEGVQIHITVTNLIEVKSSGGTAAQSAAIAEQLETLYSTAITGLKAVFDGHVHTSPAGPTGTPQNAALAPVTLPAWNAAIASTKLKIED